MNAIHAKAAPNFLAFSLSIHQGWMHIQTKTNAFTIFGQILFLEKIILRFAIYIIDFVTKKNTLIGF